MPWRGTGARTRRAGIKPYNLATELHPCAPAQPARFAEESACRLRLVPHPLELRHTGLAVTGTAEQARVRRNRAPWPARARLGLETSQTRGPRQRPGAGRETGPYPPCFEHLGRREALLFSDELDLHLLPKVGAQWMPRGTQVEIMTPGKNERRYLAGALDLRTGQVHHCLWFR